MGLFKPIWEKEDEWGRKNLDKALAAVAKMTDQAKLAVVVRDAVRGEVALAAAEKLVDKGPVRERLARDLMSDWGVRKQLWQMLEGQSAYKEVLMEDGHIAGAELRRALDAIRSQEDIVDIAEHARSIEVRRAATERIADPAVRREADAMLAPLEEARQADFLAAVEANRKAAAKREQGEKWRKEGRCPECGVRLAGIHGGVPAGAEAYCSNCGARIW